MSKIELTLEEARIVVIALRKAARTSHPILAAAERELAYRLLQQIPPPYTPEETDDV